MNREFSLHLPLRIAFAAFLAVVIQETTVSQISVFGVSADITPIVVMSIGLLCGSLQGAIAGFAIGLFVDLALFQTLGVTSLLYIAVGYWSGRLREMRDLSHGLIPMLLAAIATGFTGVGMAVIQFMLGVTAPVSFLLIEQIIVQMLINTLVALPVYEIVRRWLYPALPGDPRRRRRTYTSGAMSPLQRPSERMVRLSRSGER
jgi:rod shape-determining protein MreD